MDDAIKKTEAVIDPGMYRVQYDEVSEMFTLIIPDAFESEGVTIRELRLNLPASFVREMITLLPPDSVN